MTKWTYSYKNQKFGIYPKGTKTNTFGDGPVDANQIQYGKWTLRADVSDYIPNKKKHAQRLIKTGKSLDELYQFMTKIIDMLSPDEIGKVNPIMNAKRAVNAKG